MSRLYPARIVHLDLARGISEQRLDECRSAVYLVYFWRDIALGHCHLAADALPTSKRQLRNLAAQTIAPAVADYVLERGFKAPLPELLPRELVDDAPDFREFAALREPMHQLDRASLTTALTISVVICTRDRAQSLDRCLSSMMLCDPLPFEILVVDNCSRSNATRDVVQKYPQVTYLSEPTPGLDVARNTGIDHARGDIVAFTDDDVVVHPSWIKRIAASFDTPQVAAVTGLVLAAELKTEAQNLFETHWGFNRGYRVLNYDSYYFEKLKYRGVPAWHIGAGANMAFRRDVFESVGNFDVRLDVGAAGCSGDSEFWYRLLAAGLMCRYDPRVIAFHYHREDMEGLRRQMYYYMRGHAAALLVQFTRHKHWGNLLRLFGSLPLYYAKLFLQGVRRGFSARHRLMFSECAGLLSGIVFFLKHPRLDNATVPERKIS